MMNYIKLKQLDSIYTLIINRPKNYNALNYTLLKELDSNLDLINQDINAKALIITGEGDKAFVAGADIEEMGSMTKDEAFKFSRFGQKLLSKIENFSIPVISAINGYALGGGCELAMATHIRYASDNAILGQPEVGLGLIAGFGGTQRLHKIVGKSKALELLVSGRSIDANEAMDLGLVDKVFKQDKLMLEIEKLCFNISKNSLPAIKATIKSINYSLNNTFSKSLKEESRQFSKLFESYNMSEGTKAFLEKRKPDFK